MIKKIRKFLLHNVSWIVFVITFLLLVSHILRWQKIAVDNTTLLLLVLLLVSPFIEQLRKIKVGEFEAEIAPYEVKKLVMENEKQQIVRDIHEKTIPESIALGSDIILDLLEKDHVLALAKLRIEIEQGLTRLYESKFPTNRNKRQIRLNQIIGILVEIGTFSVQQSKRFREVISLCNRAVHGEYVRFTDASSIVDIGINLIEDINLILKKLTVKSIETQPLSTLEVDAYRSAKYRVKTIIPYVINPIQNVRIIDQRGLNLLLEGYNEYAEFIVNIEKIEIHEEE